MAGIKRPSDGGSTLLYFLINLGINIHWTIPAWVLLALHVLMGTPLSWFFIALLLWFAGVAIAYAVLCGLMGMKGGDSHKKRTPEEQAEHDRRIREISRSVGSGSYGKAAKGDSADPPDSL